MLKRPGRLGRHVDDVLDADFRRHGHAVLDVAVALAEHLQIDGEHQHIALRRHRAPQEVLREAAVLDHVELEPERLARRLRHVFDRTDRHGRERERNAGLVGGARRQDLAVAVLHAQQADRRQHERRRHFLPDDGGGEAARGDVDQHALAQLDLLHVGAVGAQRLLVIGTAVGVIEKGARNLAAGKLPQVFDTGDVFHGVPGAFTNETIG